MSENTFKSFAVLGAGTIGMPLARALTENGAKVVVFTRPSEKDKHFPPGSTHVALDVTDIPALTEQLRSHSCEVVISAINHDHLDIQARTLEAAKKACVKLYVPSEFGIPSEGQDGILAVKSKFVDELKAAEMPYLRIYAGFLTEFIPFLLGTDVDPRTAILIGEGQTPVSWTSLADVTDYLAYVLTHLPPQELSNRTLRIEGQRASCIQIIELYGTVSVMHTPAIPGTIDNRKLKEYLQTKAEMGKATVTYNINTNKDDLKTDNDLWPGHHWLTVSETLGL